MVVNIITRFSKQYLTTVTRFTLRNYSGKKIDHKKLGLIGVPFCKVDSNYINKNYNSMY